MPSGRLLRDLLVPACLAAAAIWLWVVAGQFRGGVGRYEVLGPSFFPKLLLGGLLVVALLQIVRAVIRRRAAAAPSPGIRWGSLALALAVTALYAAALEVLGFLIATVLFQLALLVLVFRQRDPKVVLAAPLALTALYAGVFVGLMAVPLPRGRWLFAEFSRLIY